MQFILEQQAQFAANIQKLEEAQLRDAPRTQRLELAFVEMVELARTVDDRLDQVDGRLDQQSAVQTRLELALTRVAEEVGQLAHAQRETEGRVADLARAQERTEAEVGDLSRSVQILAEGQREQTELLGGIVRLLEQMVRR
jgi:septal ring factor EnvC (AmiA/AmiB activator)